MTKLGQDILLQQLEAMASESRHPDTWDLDQLSSLEIVEKINQQDQTIATAVATCLPQIAQVVDKIVTVFRQGGRLIYIGAGTSGRLGILDAVECPPTFSVPATQVIGLIAGGDKAIYKAVEGAEDNLDLAKADLEQINFSHNDILIGIAASGRTPYVLGGLDYARTVGATTAAISCNAKAPILSKADYAICAVVGPEVVTGSTRMKAGTAQKMILNMLSTAAMIRSGKVYQNLMVDLHASNEKLQARAVRIVMQATECSPDIARAALTAANNSAKLAILHILTGDTIEQCQHKLQQNSGSIRQTLMAAKS
ncbi:N-acetylmuramic acid 6-phosphate etherase [Rheinheimera sp. MMS21-TC3]|uniref:N-acetylmuramic acid 6-phosphate etherase n=1 Tax=Rheinheimera sp. MMS21-TC3 TaxID=3072790 RepID=UPI0028C48E08|nr:N-acetylmuramic acid 6-phosphate etherase [Rheinheimera sp. MMS21-TC3]WNO60042.1 N-acetylmuramic acid 6-phosphate etherase [Rheinheimera sp. MMS21-TC3]